MITYQSQLGMQFHYYESLTASYLNEKFVVIKEIKKINESYLKEKFVFIKNKIKRNAIFLFFIIIFFVC